MTPMRPRSRVTLHTGGATVRNKRLTGVRALERATAPGKDIRDIGPDKGPRPCRRCSKPVGRPRATQCDACLSDQQLVKEVRAELKRLGLPALGKPVPKGSPMSKKRTKAEAGIQRLGKAPSRTASKGMTSKTAKSAAAASRERVTRICPRCFVTLPATGQCDHCRN